MKSKTGYGIIIPTTIKPKVWEKLHATTIVAQLKDLNRDAFYRLAEKTEINLALLNRAGYKFDGLSDLAIMELKAFLPQAKVDEVLSLITESDFEMGADFQYVLVKSIDKDDTIISTYPQDVVNEIMSHRESALRGYRESIIDLMKLFIDEFDAKLREARYELLQKYGGHFVYIPELESFISYRDSIDWYRGDTWDEYYGKQIDLMKSIRELASLYKLLSEGGEFQIKSTTLKHLKLTISEDSSKLLAQAITLALRIIHETDPEISSPDRAEIDKTFTIFDLMASDEAIENILEDVTLRIESYEDEFNLELFYYLADNAIEWPKRISITKKCLFLFRLAKFFKFIPESVYNESTYVSSTKEIVDGIKYKLRQMKKKDEDGKLLTRYLGIENTDL